MLFDPDGPEIPIQLLRAHRAGDVLFVVGAGISKAARLPLFGELADQIYARLGQALPGTPESLASRAEIAARDEKQYDRLIGLLEQRVVYRGTDWRQPHNAVRDAVAELLRPTSRTRLTAHADLLDLARGSDGRPRIVTTNFDTLFERAWRRRTRQRIVSSAGPAMPAVGSHDFAGVLHLHGRIADRYNGLEGTDLVLTSANFGEAYMRAGWASRFVYDLLRRYTLVLVGYSADDPPMRYMLEATEEGRLNFPDLRPAFALVGDTDNDAGSLREAWRGKGVRPLVYPAPEHDHSALYRTLDGWAQFARQPLEWATERLSAIASASPNETTTEQCLSFVYLTKEVASVGVAAEQTQDPRWLDELLPVERDETWTFVSWFRNRLADREAAEYAAGANDSTKIEIARAVDALLRSQHDPLPDLYRQYWTLFIQANLRHPPNRFGRIRGGPEITANRIRDIVELLEPRLRVDKKFRWREDDEPEREPTNIHDLAHFHFRANERDWRRLLERWPEDIRGEERLLLALDRALSEAIELGNDAGILQPDGDLMSYDLALVHAPEEGEGLVDTNDRHRGAWRLNQPDANNDRFAPIVRMMTGLWRRIFSRDVARASNIAAAWCDREPMIFKRLAAWAAIEGDRETDRRIERYLRGTTRQRYWQSDNCSELVRYYCRRWNRLVPATRRKIERAILAGMLPDVINRIAQKGNRSYARALYTARELARIRSAGGRLSRPTANRLARLYRSYPDLPREMPIFAHLYSPSWSGSGYSADIRVLDQVTDDELLESAEAFESSNRIEQADLWTVFARNEPRRAFSALYSAHENRAFPSDRWQPLLGLYGARGSEELPDDLPPLSEILDVISEVPIERLSPVAYQLASIIEQNARTTEDTTLPKILRLWDQLAAGALALDEGDYERPLAELVFSHPIGIISDSLVSMLDEMRLPPGNGIADNLKERFDLLANMSGRAGLIARGALLQQFAFLRTIAPEWVDANLLPELVEENDEAVELMSVIARSVAPQYSEMFNLLKGAILHALEHDRTEEATREQLSGALVGAALAIIEGVGGFDLTSVECRRALTRMPNNVLARMAWELTSLLRQKSTAQDRERCWDNVVAPFLLDYWPNDVSARTHEVSENLAHLPGLAGGAFERAVALVLDLVCPIQRYELSFGLGLDDDENHLELHPQACLMLLSSILDRSSPPPRDLAETLDRILSADANLAAEPAFWRLRQMCRAD